MEYKKIAIILAAGGGIRLKRITFKKPKPMVVINGISIIRNLVEDLIESGIDEIVILVGYMADMVRNHLADYRSKVKITFLENKKWATTNNIYTLWLARDYLLDGFYLFEADIYCEKSIIDDLINDERENIIVVDKFTSLMNGTVVIGKYPASIVKKMYLKKDQKKNFNFLNAYKTVNFYKIGKLLANPFFVEKLKNHINKKNVNFYYEIIISELIDQGFIFYTLKAGGRKWWEIDTQEDFNVARKIFFNQNTKR